MKLNVLKIGKIAAALCALLPAITAAAAEDTEDQNIDGWIVNVQDPYIQIKGYEGELPADGRLELPDFNSLAEDPSRVQYHLSGFEDITALEELIIPECYGRVEISSSSAFRNCDITRLTLHASGIYMPYGRLGRQIAELNVDDLNQWCENSYFNYDAEEPTCNNPLAYNARIFVKGVEQTELNISGHVSDGALFQLGPNIAKVNVKGSIGEGNFYRHSLTEIRCGSVDDGFEFRFNTQREEYDVYLTSPVPSAFTLQKRAVSALKPVGRLHIASGSKEFFESKVKPGTVEFVEDMPMPEDYVIVDHMMFRATQNKYGTDILIEEANLISVSEAVNPNAVVPESVTVGGKSLPVTYVSPNAAIGNKTLKTITLPATCNRIGEYAFKDCKNLSAYTVPESTRIWMFAFENCVSLTEVTLTGPALGYGIFWGCTNLSTVHVTAGCTSLYGGMFGDNDVRHVYFYAPEPPAFTNGYDRDYHCWYYELGLYREDAYENPTIVHVPKGCKDEYESVSWIDGDYEVVEDIDNGIDEVAADHKSGSVEVFNIAGIRVHTGAVPERGALPAGIYMVRYQDGSVGKIAY